MDEISRATRRNGLRVMQIGGATPGGNLKAFERLGNVDSAAKRNHEFAITALHNCYF